MEPTQSLITKGSEGKIAYLWTYILNIPFWVIFNMLPFILWKDLGASLWQITLMVTLKPMVAIFSVYWSDYVNKRQDRLVSNVVLGSVLGHLPFLFFPWFQNVWWFIASFALYKLLYRGVIPAWMEILKLTTSGDKSKKIVSYSNTISYVGGAIFPVFFGWMMDDYSEAWRYIFPITALISLSAVALQLRIVLEEKSPTFTGFQVPSLSRPWKNVWALLRRRTDYTLFQVGFMLGGFGIMIIQPALPQFFMNTLGLNYKELGMAITMFKGIGFALTSGIWANWMNRVNIFRFSALVVFMFALFPLGLISAQAQIILLYFTYFSYGVMQAGSQLAWKLSGPIFAMNDDSSLFSSVNVLTVGMRGLIANPLGGILTLMGGPVFVMIVGSLFCMSAAAHFSWCSRKVEKSLIPPIAT